MFSPVQKSSEARGKEYDQVWGRVFNSIILNVITDAPPTTEREKKTLSASWRCSVFLPSSCLIWKTPDDSVVSGGEEALRGERRSGCSSVPRLSTSNPIRSPTRLRVRLQTGSESLRGDEPDDPEWSGSGCRCYGPVVLDAAARLAGGSQSRNTTAKYFIHDSFHLADDMFQKKETGSSCSARKSEGAIVRILI